MNIYILTTNSTNYGSILQKYSLFSYIKENICRNVYVINTKFINNSDRIFSNTQNYSGFFMRLYMKYCEIINKNKKIKIKNFEDKNIETKSYDFFINNVKDDDVIIVGSDQVWNPDSLYNIYTLDRKEFYSMNKNIKKITYAVSMPKEAISQEQKEYFKKILSNFDSISVRETISKKILSELTDKKIEICLDPTFLIDSKKIENTCLPDNNNEEYILMYMVRPMNIVKKVAKKISKMTGLKIINLGNINVIDGKIKNANKSGIEEFLAYFKNAKYVVTNSFHGTVFSIIFRKKFISISLPYTGSRAKDLLDKFELNNRLITNIEEYNKIFDDIDYAEAYKKIFYYQNISKKYLEGEIEKTCI